MATRRERMNAYRMRFGVILLNLFVWSFAFMLMLWITNRGTGISPDSTIYIEAARSLRAGNGLVVYGEPMTHYPPAYPLLIWAVDSLHTGDILHATRLLSAFFFAGNLTLLGLAVYACTKRSLLAMGTFVLLFLFSSSCIFVHAMAWTEAPFITCSIASIFLFSCHVTRPRLHLIVLAGFMAGLAVATRYVGIVLFPTIVIAFILLKNRSAYLKMKDLAIFVGLASLPLAYCIIRNILVARSATNREFAHHPFDLGHVKSMIYTIGNFALPIPISPWIKTICVAIAVILLFSGISILYIKGNINRNAQSVDVVFSLICLVYSVTYVVLLFFSLSFFDAHTPLDNRILLPVIFPLAIASIIVARSLSRELNRRSIWHVFALLVFSIVSVNVIPAMETAVDIHIHGRGYTSRIWSNSEIIAYLSGDAHGGRTIYSNAPDAIRFLAGKESVMIPAKVSPNSLRANESYEDALKKMIQECIDGRARIVYFDTITSRWYLPSAKEIEATGTLPILTKMQDGIIYGKR